MSIYSNDNIRKIAKLTTRELPQKSKNAKITVRENNGLYSTLESRILRCFLNVCYTMCLFLIQGQPRLAICWLQLSNVHDQCHLFIVKPCTCNP